jgi:hypothetical protein
LKLRPVPHVLKLAKLVGGEDAAALRANRQGNDTVDAMAAAFAAEITAKLGATIDAHEDDFGVSSAVLDKTVRAPAVRAALRSAQHEARVREIGREVIRARGANNGYIDGDIAEMARDSARQFARKDVAPRAEHIHRHDEMVPADIIGAMRELGYFGMSIPEEYGGQGMGNLAMIVITEELSCASLAAAGSLITRPEILAKALLKGGTEAQKKQWLPPVAAGDLMVGISVTEPDTGSDVAAIRTRAERVDGGWVLNGAKTFITNGVRADFYVTAVRTRPQPGHGSLSFLVVEAGDGVTARPLEKLGWHASDTAEIAFEDVAVPDEALLGEEGRGFYLIVANFQWERLLMSLGAVGSMRATLERVIARSGFINIRRHGFGRLGRIHDLKPSLLSSSCVCLAEAT